MASKRTWCVYILRCGDESLYCGATNDLKRRMRAHDQGRGARYTRGRGPFRLAYCRRSLTRSQALKEEARIKGLTKRRKEELIRSKRPRSFAFDFRRASRIFHGRLRKGEGNMAQWDNIQKGAKKIIDEGLKLLRSGMSEAEYIAEATAESTRLHIISRRNRFDMYKAVHDLGYKVYEAALKNPSAKEVALSDGMKRTIANIGKMEAEAKKAEASISKLTVTNKGKTKPRKKSKKSQ